MENIKQLIINVENDDWENAYFIYDVILSLRYVYDVELEEENEMNVIFNYDSTIWTVEKIMDCIDYARQDIVSFYMELTNADLVAEIVE